MSNELNQNTTTDREQISFSMLVKNELVKNIPPQRHCRIAELSVLIASYCTISGNSLLFKSDNEKIAQKYFTLLKKTFNICADAFENKGFFAVEVKNQNDIVIILQAVKIFNAHLEVQNHEGIVPNVLIKNECCRRSFVKTAFLCYGTISDPTKGAHLEYVFYKEAWANQLIEVLKTMDISAKLSIRKNKRYVVYVKEREDVGDFLRMTEASVAIMEFENTMIKREIANNQNRINNCDVANSGKQIEASQKQLDDIEYLNECIGLSNLPDTLRSVAEARLENPDVGLKELGELMKPPLGKSGVNHRLRKISEMAQKHREKNNI